MRHCELPEGAGLRRPLVPFSAGCTPWPPCLRLALLSWGPATPWDNLCSSALLMLIPVLFGVSIIVFSILQLTPGDPALLALGEFAPPEQLEATAGTARLNDPPHVQYLRWVTRAVQLDLGQSLRSNRPVTEEIASRMPATGQLALYAVTLAALIGIPAGVISATRPNSFIDNAVTVAALAGVSMPVFWQALMLMIIFSVQLRLAAVVGHGGRLEILRPARGHSGHQRNGGHRPHDPRHDDRSHPTRLRPDGPGQRAVRAGGRLPPHAAQRPHSRRYHYRP